MAREEGWSSGVAKRPVRRKNEEVEYGPEQRRTQDQRQCTSVSRLGRAKRASPDLEQNFTFSFLLEAAMAASASWQDFLEEATCSICLDYFEDPVLIPDCGHNFCWGCLSRSSGTSESEASCPQCRQTYAPRSVFPNRQLARVAEVARGCSHHPEEEGGSFCPKHREPLKLFCKDHETLICMVCDRSKEHKGHSVIPAEEAFQEYQDLIEKVKKNIVAEFRELQLWLEGQEKLLLTKMEETEKDIMARKEKGHWKHLEEILWKVDFNYRK
ncbi:hypothetical protein E2320_014518 [Naja naja]|nr:hypothetical protein E2320_014518 [Naja naja]